MPDITVAQALELKADAERNICVALQQELNKFQAAAGLTPSGVGIEFVIHMTVGEDRRARPDDIVVTKVRLRFEELG